MNPLMRVAFGSGRLPDRMRAAMYDGAAGEPFLLLEGLAGSITYRRYRERGWRASWYRAVTTGAVAVTSEQFLVWAGRAKRIHVPHVHPLRSEITITAEKPTVLCFAFDAGRFSDTRSGQVEIRLRTSQAEQAAQVISAHV